MEVRRPPNFSYLLAGIILFLVVGPTLETLLGNRLDSIVLMTCYTGMLIVSLWGLHETRWIFLGGTGLAALSVAIIIIDGLMANVDLSLLSLIIYLLFQIATIWLACAHLFEAGEVTLNKIVGGTCVYFLIGMSWAIFYAGLLYYDPESFTGSGLIDPGQIYWDMTYFSFVTLTTLGYGDILPVSPVAKALTYIEAVVGQIYVAVLIGALVASYINQARNKAQQRQQAKAQQRQGD